ncbi:MAG: DUF308 domain-containing protein [Actinomycetes bacterium]
MTSTGNNEVVVGAVVPLEDVAKAAAQYWWLILLGGLISLGLGFFLVFHPVKGAHSIAIVIGLYLVLVGVMDLIHSLSAEHKAPAMAAGLIALVLGLILMFKSGLTINFIAVLWGIGFIISGLVRIVVAIAERGYGWGWRLVLGFLGLGLGAVVVSNPTATAGVVVFIVGLSSILTGITWTVMSFSLRSAPKRIAAAGGGDVVVIF